MSVTDWVVIVGAAVAIAWVNWYFFFAGGRDGGSTGGAAGEDHEGAKR